MQRKVFAATLLILSLVAIPHGSAATIKAGAKCPKQGAVATSAKVKYICAKSARGLIWTKAKIVPKPTPKATASAKPVARPTPTPSVSPSATPTPTATASSNPSASPSASPSATPSVSPSATPTPSASAAKLSQTITTPTEKKVEITSGNIDGAFSSSSKLSVALSTSTSLICQVSGSSISLLQTGQCSIVANQSGNDKYSAAPPSSFTFDVIAPKITSEDANLDDVKSFVRVPKGTMYASDTAQITLIEVVSDASAKVCALDDSAEGCLSNNGVGIVDTSADTRYVEFEFKVTNLDGNPLPNISYRLLIKSEVSDVDAGVSFDTLNDVVVNSKQSATGSLFGLVPKDLKLDGGYVLIDSGITDFSVRVLLEITN